MSYLNKQKVCKHQILAWQRASPIHYVNAWIQDSGVLKVNQTQNAIWFLIRPTKLGSLIRTKIGLFSDYIDTESSYVFHMNNASYFYKLSVVKPQDED